jgi:Protein of unknown function (DUF3309)
MASCRASDFQRRWKKKATRLRAAREVPVMRTIFLIILIILLLGALPTWPYSTGWGYYPSGGFGLILLIVIILAVMGKL